MAAELHAEFHGRVPEGAAELSDRLGMASPAVAHAERAGSDLLPKQFEHAWEAFGDRARGRAGPVLRLSENPGPLAEALVAAHGAPTLIHDWDLATAGTPMLEEDHRAAQGERVCERELEFGMLSGLVQYGWLLARSARVHPNPAETEWGRDELSWWIPRARRALERPGGGSARRLSGRCRNFGQATSWS